MAVSPAIATVQDILNPPTDAETLSMYNPDSPSAERIAAHISSHPFVESLRAQSDKYIESRPHLKIPATMRPHNLTGGILMGEDKLEVPPLTFSDTNSELPTMISFHYLGPALCGHPGIAHGGLLATLLDEGLARACFPALPNKIGVTASLKLDYRAPCPAGSYVVLRAETIKVEGRKAWVKGQLELLGQGKDDHGLVVVEAEALFVEPKGAKQMARIHSA